MCSHARSRWLIAAAIAVAALFPVGAEAIQPTPPASGAAPASAPPTDLPKQLEELAALQESIPTLEGDQREEAIDRAIQWREKLLPLLPRGDAKSISMRYDQAAAVLARLARDGADTSLLVGIADPDRRKSAAAAVDQAAELLKDLPRERAPLRELLLRGRMELLRSRLEDRPAAAVQAAKRAIAAFHDAERSSATIPEAEAFRRAGLALSLFYEGSREAIPLSQRLLKDLSASEHPTDLEIQATRLLTSANPADIERAIAQFDAIESSTPLDRVLRLEIGTRAMLNVWRSTREGALLTKAMERLAGMVERDELGIPAQGRREIAERLIAAVLDEADVKEPIQTWPALAMLAMGDRAARNDLVGARAIYDGVAARPDASELAGEAVWRAAVAGPRGGEGDDQRLPRLLDLVRKHADHPRATDAAGEAIAIAMRTGEAKDGLKGAATEAEAPVPPAAREALELAVGRFPDAPQIAAWRLLLARALAEGGDWRGAIAQLDRIPASAPEGSRAGEAIFAIAALRLGELSASLAKAEGASVKAIATERLALARRSRDALAPRLAPDDAKLVRLRVEVAEAMLDAGEGDARDMFRTLLPLSAKVPGGRPRVTLGLARAKLASGEQDEGFKELKALTAELDARDDRSAQFWHAWTLIIETIAAEKGRPTAPVPESEASQPAGVAPAASPDYAGAARANVEKLRTIDGTLGGEPWRSRIERALEGMGR